MDQELEILIKERYKVLPEDVKLAIGSLPMQEIMQEIGSQNDLRIDQIGILYSETMLVMLGVEKLDAFERNIRENLGVDAVTAKNIGIAVNERVFLSVRETLKKLQEIQSQEAVSNESNAEDGMGTREDILAEIENPTPTEHPITVPSAGPAKPREIIPEAKATKESVAKEFIAGKLSETVSLPSQKVTIGSEKQILKDKKYSADPYREAIN